MLNRLSTIRNQHNVTEEFVARVTGISLQQYQEYEKQNSKIPETYLSVLCDAFGVESSDILYEEKEPRKQEEITGLARTYAKLGKHDLKEIEKVYAIRSRVSEI